MSSVHKILLSAKLSSNNSPQVSKVSAPRNNYDPLRMWQERIKKNLKSSQNLSCKNFTCMHFTVNTPQYDGTVCYKDSIYDRNYAAVAS